MIITHHYQITPAKVDPRHAGLALAESHQSPLNIALRDAVANPASRWTSLHSNLASVRV